MAIRILAAVALFMLNSMVSAAPPITAITYDTAGKLLAVGSRNQTEIVDATTHDVIKSIPSVTGRVTALAWGTNFLAVASGEPGQAPVIQLWNTKNWTVTASLAGHKDSVYALAISKDGSVLASAGYDRTIQLWQLSATIPTKPILTLLDHSDTVYSLSFHPTKKLLATAAADRSVKVWDTTTGKRLYTLSDSTDWLYAVAWSPDGTRIAAGGVDKSLRIWKADEQAGTLESSAFAHAKAITRIAFTTDSKKLFTVSEDRTLKLWDSSTLRETRTSLKQPIDILAFAYNPNGNDYAVGLYDGTVHVYDAKTGQLKASPLPAKPKPPSITKIVPNSLVRGVTTQVTVSGRNLGNASELFSPDRTATRTQLVPGKSTAESVQFDVTVHGIEEPGPVSFKLKNDVGVSSAFTLNLDRYPAVAETGNTESARVATPISIPCTAVGVLDRTGDVDYFQMTLQAGQEIAVEAIAPAFKPVLTITDSTGAILLETDRGYAGFRAPQTSTYAIGIRDREFKGGPTFTYRIGIGQFPVVTSVFPLGVTRGKSQTVHVNGVFLPPEVRTQTVVIKPDAKPGEKVGIMIPASTTGSEFVVVSDYPSVIVDATIGATLATVPATADGILLEPGASQMVKFNAKKGQTLVVEALARRFGSPVDPVVEILDIAGKPVPRATLRCVAKTAVTFRDHDSAQPNIRIETWNELKPNDLVYVGTELMRIRQLPGHPDADCNFWQTNGQRVGFLETTPTHHANNEPMYKVEIHPPGTVFPPNGMPVFALPFINDDGGPGYGKDARITFVAPADGNYFARVTDSRGQGGQEFAYRLTVRPPAPDFQVSMLPLATAVWRGGTLPITVNINRVDGFDGPVTIALEGLPKGFASSAVTIESGFSSATVGISADDTAMSTKPQSATLVTRGEILGKTVERRVKLEGISVVAPGDITATVAVTELKLKPGGEVRFVVRITRNNNFKGRIPLDVKGLPHGVNIQNIGLNGVLINENEAEREIVLKAEPWVKPMVTPVIPFARREGKNTEHGTVLMLKISQE